MSNEFHREHLQTATGASCRLMIRRDALRLKHSDNKTQSLRHSQIATSFVGRQLTFTPTDFSSQSFEVGGEEGGRAGGGGGGRGTRHCQPLLTCSSIHLFGSEQLIIILISPPPLQSTPIDSCPLIHKLLTEKGAADIFTSFLQKKKKRYDSMLMILSYFSFMRIQIKWEAMHWLSALAFDRSFSIYPSKH